MEQFCQHLQGLHPRSRLRRRFGVPMQLTHVLQYLDRLIRHDHSISLHLPVGQIPSTCCGHWPRLCFLPTHAPSTERLVATSNLRAEVAYQSLELDRQRRLHILRWFRSDRRCVLG